MISKQGTIILYKKRGETPLECLDRFKKDNPEYREDKMTYAGRLDPLAEGLLLVLVGEECKNKEKYLGMDKEYEVGVLFGFATDTYDILGIPQTSADFMRTDAEKIQKFLEVGPPHASEVVPQKISSIKPGLLHSVRKDIQKTLQSFIGRFYQKYPAYSSKNIKKILKEREGQNRGLALRSEAGKGESSVFSDVQDNIFEKDVEIKSIEFLSERTISKNDLEKYIKDSVALVKGDFRQEEILSEWQKALSRVNLDEFQVISIKVSCTSGTYMRSLANSIGEKVGIPVLALNIRRIKVGEYVL